MPENKRRKKFFKREVVLDKLLSAGEVSAGILLGLVLEFADIAKAMHLPPQQALRALKKQPYRHIDVDIKSKVAFWTLLSKLKKENLIARNQKGKIALTKKGEDYLQSKNKELTRGRKYILENIPQEEIILVIFDIPEKEREKRDWLRFQLEQFDFKVLQKSVWWGMFGLPKEFIKDLKKYEILPYVHIFSVRKQGTISLAVIENQQLRD